MEIKRWEAKVIRLWMGSSFGSGVYRLELVGIALNSSCEFVPFSHKTFFFSVALLVENSGELMHVDLG